MHFLQRQLHKALNVTKTLLSLDENTRRWNALKGAYAGQRVFLIGNGPSLNETPLYLLKDELTLCFNRFHLMHERIGWQPHFYMCIDPEVLPDIAEEINAHGPQYAHLIVHALHSRAIIKRPNVLLMHHIVQVPYFSRRLPLFGSGGTVAYAGLQALLFLGFKEIYLVGVDQNYVLHQTARKTAGIRIESQHDDDPNHFDPRYFGKGRRYHQPVPATQRRMIRAFERARQVASSGGALILNAGVGGALEVFQRIPFGDVVSMSIDKQLELLARAISPHCNPRLLRDLLEQPSASHTENAPRDDDVLVLDASEGMRHIQKLVLDYVPFGPILGRYLFVRRERRDQVVREKLA
jgi:hypothetical protein